jgi:hypothetical protein
MKNQRRTQSLTTPVAALALAAACMTAATAATRLPNGAWIDLAPKQYDSLSVVNGGITIDESAAAKQMAPQYPLRVVLSGRGGDYQVADRMTVMRGDRVLAEIPDAGPWLLIDMPPGRYTLRGEFDGHSMTRTVTVGSKGTTVHWVVPPSVH